jgi:hypothetical protein
VIRLCSPLPFSLASFRAPAPRWVGMASFFAVEERSVAFGLYSIAIASRGAARSAASVAASTAPPLAGAGAAAPANLRAEKPKSTPVELKAVGGSGAVAASGAGAPAKKKYVPPVVAEAPRKRRAPLVRLPSKLLPDGCLRRTCCFHSRHF